MTDDSDAAGLALIEAGYSVHRDDHVFNSNRMYIPTGYYDAQDQWIPRSDEATRIYDSLARLARKLAPNREYMLDNGVCIKCHVSPAIQKLLDGEGYKLSEIVRLNDSCKIRRTPEEMEERMKQMKDPANYVPFAESPAYDQLVEKLGRDVAQQFAAMGMIAFTPPDLKKK